MSTSCLIGVDVCKDRFDVFVRPTGERNRFDNSPDGIRQLLEWVRPFQPHRVVFESTGHYQKAAVGVLLSEGLPAVVVNARQVRDFAKGTNQLAKTDALDAAVLAHFAEVVATIVRPLPTPETQEFRDFFDRRSQLVRMLAAEKNHLHAAQTASLKIRRNIERVIDFLSDQIKTLEKRMDQIIDDSDTFKAKNDILQSITGIGPQVSRSLLVQLPELGQVSNQAIAALVGVAPFADDSGQSRGARHIRGGRGKVRQSLYQAAIAAIRHCPAMKAFYAKLKQHGKASRVAIIAVARKILVLANALIRTMTPYNPNHANSVCRP